MDRTLFYKKQQLMFKDWVECPIKHSNLSANDLLKQRQTLVFRAGSAVDGIFGDNGHQAWHSFEKTLGSTLV